jgi:O-acetyl-ADP-ribose deacetylase (regulator of RNase III)
LNNSIKVYKGNLFDYIRLEQIDTIINAANGVGVMGCGIAGAIKKYGGGVVQTDALNVCRKLNPLPGTSYLTTSGNLLYNGVDRIIHAVTMKNPGGETSYDIIGSAFESALSCAVSKGTNKIGCTALGTGVGRLLPDKVADIMYNVALKFIEKLDIIFIDLDTKFINRLFELTDNKG